MPRRLVSCNTWAALAEELLIAEQVVPVWGQRAPRTFLSNCSKKESLSLKRGSGRGITMADDFSLNYPGRYNERSTKLTGQSLQSGLRQSFFFPFPRPLSSFLSLLFSSSLVSLFPVGSCRITRKA